MSIEPQHISFDEFVSNTREILREVERRGEGILIEHGDHSFALTPKQTENQSRESHLSRSDGLFEIIGLGESEEPTDISKHKHDYIAQATDHIQSGTEFLLIPHSFSHLSMSRMLNIPRRSLYLSGLHTKRQSISLQILCLQRRMPLSLIA